MMGSFFLVHAVAGDTGQILDLMLTTFPVGAQAVFVATHALLVLCTGFGRTEDHLALLDALGRLAVAKHDIRRCHRIGQVFMAFAVASLA